MKFLFLIPYVVFLAFIITALMGYGTPTFLLGIAVIHLFSAKIAEFLFSDKIEVQK